MKSEDRSPESEVRRKKLTVAVGTWQLQLALGSYSWQFSIALGSQGAAFSILSDPGKLKWQRYFLIPFPVTFFPSLPCNLPEGLKVKWSEPL